MTTILRIPTSAIFTAYRPAIIAHPIKAGCSEERRTALVGSACGV